MIEHSVHLRSCSQRHGRGGTGKRSWFPSLPPANESPPSAAFGPEFRAPAAPVPCRLLPEHAWHPCLFADQVSAVRQASPHLSRSLAQANSPFIASMKSCSRSNRSSGFILCAPRSCPESYSVVPSPPRGWGMAPVPHWAFSCIFPQG